MFLAYLVLTTIVWDRNDFGGLLAAVPLLMLSGLVDRQTAAGRPHYQPFGPWLGTVVIQTAGLAATLAIGIAVLGEIFDRQTLESTGQRAVVALLSAVAIFALVYVLLAARATAEPATSIDREARRAEVRARIRREIEQMELASVAQVPAPEDTVTPAADLSGEQLVRDSTPPPNAAPEAETAVETAPETWETRDWAAFLAKISSPDVAA